MSLYECKTINPFGGIDYFIEEYPSAEEAKKGFENSLCDYTVLDVWKV